MLVSRRVTPFGNPPPWYWLVVEDTHLTNMLFQLDHFPEFKRWKLEQKHMKKTPPFFRSYPYPSSHVMVQWKMNLLLKETFFWGKLFPAYPWLWGGRVCTCMSCPWNQDESASKIPSDFFVPNPSLHQILDPWPIDPKEDPLKETFSHRIHGTGICLPIYLFTYMNGSCIEYLPTWMVDFDGTWG